MTTPVTIPDPLVLLPPLLAYLPTSFASSRPPPDLLPLLSPILRQRIHIHTSSTTKVHESWLRLLCWDSVKADQLSDTVESANFEPHPVSGEVEVGEVEPITYKRSDSETLKAHIPLSDWSLSVIYLWCMGGDDGDGWKLTELFALDSDLQRDPTWSKSIEEAEVLAHRIATEQTTRVTRSANAGRLSVPNGQADDDDYWAMYDNTPGRTPARKHSSNPQGSAIPYEDDYFAQYGDVQPALDGHDPDEEQEDIGESGLNGNALQEMLARSTAQHAPATTHANLHTHLEEQEEEGYSLPVRQPTPSSPRSRAGSETVEKLETQAERYAASEIGIRHHIGYSVKSMFRLAKSAGISRQEFEDMVLRELETLSILDRDD